MATTYCQSLAANIADWKQQRDELQAEDPYGNRQLIAELNGKIATATQEQTDLRCSSEGTLSAPSPAGAGMDSSGNITVNVIVSSDGSIFYTWWPLGGGNPYWWFIPDAPQTDDPPAVALVGDNHDYLFITVRERGTNILKFTQGTRGGAFTAWIDVP